MALRESLERAAGVLEELRRDAATLGEVERVRDLLVGTLVGGGTILVCGNGGSACDAAHFAEELTGRFRAPPAGRGERPALAAIACNDAGHITCTANDFGFERVFERWVSALARQGDAVVLLSTSGNSPNLVLAARAARARGAVTIGLLGRGGGELRGACDRAVVVPGATSDRIQELHMLLLHALVEEIEDALHARGWTGRGSPR